jgi:Ca-activated chloride channel homolog
MHEAATIPFHLLRPQWLVALVPVFAILALVLWRQRAETQWGGVVASHLLKHLIVRPHRKWGINPIWLVATAMTLGIVALSGPTWRRELPPFVEDKAPLMIALSLSSSMRETDIAPSRLDRAKQKISDLLAARAGARTGLIAYAATSHLVMPLTDDRTVIEPFLAAVAPELMPSDGHNAIAAVALASQSLATEPVAGTILVVADDPGNADEAAQRRAAGRNNLLMLEVAAAEPPSGAVRVSVDSSDIRTIERRIDTRYETAQGDTFGVQWLDEGYWLLLPIGILSLLWFRRGTTVAWILAFFLCFPAWPASAQESPRFENLWLTPDQQGRLAFDRGDFTAAARLFADPMWRGIAFYRTYDFWRRRKPSRRSTRSKASLRSPMRRPRTTPLRRQSMPTTLC